MARLTRAKIHSKVEAIRKQFGADIAVNFYRPGPRSLGQITSFSEGRLISPRLPINELEQWIDGFVQSYVEFERKRTDFATLLTAAHTLCYPGSVNITDWETARRIVIETHDRYGNQNPSKQTDNQC